MDLNLNQAKPKAVVNNKVNLLLIQLTSDMFSVKCFSYMCILIYIAKARLQKYTEDKNPTCISHPCNNIRIHHNIQISGAALCNFRLNW